MDNAIDRIMPDKYILEHFSLLVLKLEKKKNRGAVCEGRWALKFISTNSSASGSWKLTQKAMALLRHHFNYSLRRTCVAQSGGDEKERFQEALMNQPETRLPAEQFAPLASTFRRRILVGVGSASLVAVGANFAGVTSSLLGFFPESGRNLKLDVLYPINGYSRCIEVNEGFG